VPPIHLATTFIRNEDGNLTGGYLYSRYQNPNRQELERCLQDLEGGAACACFASGSAAANAVLQCLDPKDRVLCSDDLYFGIRKLFMGVGRRAGIRCESIDMTDLGALAAASKVRPELIYCETPTNPLVKITDIRAVVQIAKRCGALVLVDNTWATPLLQRPLELGADFVLHATTKYLSGHSDAVGGALLARDPAHPLWERVLELQRLAGAVPSPFDCWLILRGIATLAVRLRAAVDNAEKLAAWLSTHPSVEKVFHPGLKDHPGSEIARRQMARPGAMLSFLVRGGEEAARRVLARVRLWLRATSLGGVHSLIEHRAVVEGPDSPTPRNLIRLSAGIEGFEDLKADLDQALSREVT
jgi:cystathionine gamma-synthase